MTNPTLPPLPSTIANLPLANSPLAGNEWVPISQDGVTVKVAADGFTVVGPAGPTGQTGATGATGAPGPSGGAANIASSVVNNLAYYNSSTTLAGVTSNANSILVTNGSGAPSIGTALPNGITATTQSMGDNTTKIATTAFVTASTVLFTGGTTTGSANAQAVTVTPSSFAYTSGNIVTFTAGFTNTGITNLNVNGLGTIDLVKAFYIPVDGNGVNLSGGEILASDVYMVYVINSSFGLLLNPSTSQFTTEFAMASAATVDLGVATSNVVDITGTTTITSLASTANPAFPIFFLRFAGALTLTNGASLILPGGANITTAAGDCAIAKVESSTVVRIIGYFPASGFPNALPQATSSVFGAVKVDGTTITAASGVISAKLTMTALAVDSIIMGHMAGSPSAGTTAAAANVTVYGLSAAADPIYVATGDSITGTWLALQSMTGTSSSFFIGLLQRIA